MSSHDSRVSATHTLRRSALAVVLLFLVGVVGYTLLEEQDQGLVDAVYMTVITLTTTGYGEVVDLHDSPAGKTFTSLLLLAGVGALAYFFSSVTAFMVEGELGRVFWRRRMSKAIGALEGHVIVCGAGHTGHHVVQELVATKRPFVLVDSSQERIDELAAEHGGPFVAVCGDAGEDETLKEAGIERASGLVSTVSSDRDNLLVVVSARMLNPNLRIVSRCIDEDMASKIRRAGADAIVSPNRIGGLRLVSELVRPQAVSYLDLMLRDRDEALRVEAATVEPGSELDGGTVGGLRGAGIEGLAVLALRRPDGSWVQAPRAEQRIEAGWSVVFVSPPATREKLSRLCAPRS